MIRKAAFVKSINPYGKEMQFFKMKILIVRKHCTFLFWSNSRFFANNNKIP